MRKPTPTGRETTFDDNEVIVSKTKKTGRIAYANDVFLKMAKYAEAELIVQPHRHWAHTGLDRALGHMARRARRW